MKKFSLLRTFINQHSKSRGIKSSNLNPTDLSRRSFLKTTTYFTLGSVTVGHSFGSVLAQKGGIALIVAPFDLIASAGPPMWALGELKAALEAQGSTVRIITQIADSTANEFCVVASGMKTTLAQSILISHKLLPPTEPESLCLVQDKIEGRSVLLAAGTDQIGLVYALTELTDRLQCIATGRSALEFDKPVIERPASRIRSILRQFSSDIEDKVWFYDRDFWNRYLNMLVTSRVNRLNFAMGMGYNSANGISDGYLVFPYPFFVSIPGYDVNVRGLSDEERERNLTMLKFIGEETTRRGLRFQIGIWTLAYKWQNSPDATYSIEGLTDATHSFYCKDALAALLHAVPTITGITFRVHNESGIPKGQESFWKTQFNAIAECGRRVEIDMHAKNMEPQTLEFALATGQPVVISPKFSGEHLILPYHQSAIREYEMVSEDKFKDTGIGVLIGNRGFTRYGYADTLAENRTWDVVFRIWPGTQRFLLNGDPATFAGYGRIASFCGAGGIELTEPLGFKGRQGTGITGGRCAYSDTSLSPRYDFEKYHYTYRLWGRLGYNPLTNPEIWRRTLTCDFGTAAVSVEKALAQASRVLPLFTLAHGPSADCLIYWPEIYTNMPIADIMKRHNYNDTQNPKLFGNVSPFDPQLFQSPNECGDALIAGRATGKYSPLEVAQWLEDIAANVTLHIQTAHKQMGSGASKPDFRRIEEDVLIQKGLAIFFACKLRSAVLWRIFMISGNSLAGEASIAHYNLGRKAWVEMAERAVNVYRTDITYGRNNLRGHWLDRVPSFDEDIADLKKRLEAVSVIENKPDITDVERALKTATSKPKRPSVVAQHKPLDRYRSAKPVAISILITSGTPHRVTLHYRHVNQAERWQSIELTPTGDTSKGEIPASYTDKRYALQYYFEIETSQSEATLFPQLASDLANVPYYVMHREA